MSRAEILDCVERHLRNETKAQPCEDIIEIPKNATNGDVIEAVFPNVAIYKHGSTYSINNEYNFNETWWNAPYKAGKRG